MPLTNPYCSSKKLINQIICCWAEQLAFLLALSVLILHNM
uniref:Uncharacterized protein n=1 Tax=Anguilla anguilla TaxID=7936 RepID=A0A0E9WZT3_ANGAN